MPSDTLIRYGNDLESGVLQAGYTIENDGYGLLTCRATYKIDTAIVTPIPPSRFARGSDFEKDTRLKLHKWSVTYNTAQVSTVTGDYVGIEIGQFTRPNCHGDDGLSTEKIETHPNFFTITAGSTASQPIAGKQSTWHPSPNNLAQGGVNLMEGNNGATFQPASEANKGGKFLGFYNENYPDYYGKTSYLAPTTVFTGIVYTTEASNVNMMKTLVGAATNQNDLGLGGFPQLVPPEYGTTWTAPNGNPQLLLSKVNCENYGLLYKINYEIRYSREGFPYVVYPNTLLYGSGGGGGGSGGIGSGTA
jgi:hypothetical protein